MTKPTDKQLLQAISSYTDKVIRYKDAIKTFKEYHDAKVKLIKARNRLDNATEIAEALRFNKSDNGGITESDIEEAEAAVERCKIAVSVAKDELIPIEKNFNEAEQNGSMDKAYALAVFLVDNEKYGGLV